MTCRNCISFAECLEYESTPYYGLDAACNNVEQLCENFKNKADFVEVVRCEKCTHKVDYCGRIINEIIFCGDEIELCTGAFQGNKISVLNLPKNVKFYNEKTGQSHDGVFGGSPTLKSVELPDGSVKEFTGLFSECPMLEKINIPKGTEKITSYAFAFATALKEIEIPRGIKQVAASCFFECGIENIYYGGTRDEWGSIYVDDSGGTVTLEGVNILFGYTDGSGSSEEEENAGSLDGINSLVYYGNANIVPSNADIFSLTVLNEANRTGYLYPLDFPGNLSGEIVLPYEFEFEGKVYKNVELGDSSFGYAACDSLIIPNSVKVLRPVSFWQAQIKEITFCGDTFEIQENAFMDCTTLTDIYYRGRESDWNKKVKGKENIPTTATIHFLGI